MVVRGVGQVKDLTVVVGLCGRHSGGIQRQRDVLNVGGVQDAAFKVGLAAEVPVVGGVTATRGEWFTHT